MAGRLFITIKRATDVGSGDPETASANLEPYCVCQIPGVTAQSPDTTFKTQGFRGETCWKPVWEHKGEISDGALNSGLEFQVWDARSARPDGLLGTASFPCDDMDKGTHTLKLTSGGKSAGTLVIELHGEALGAGAELETPMGPAMRHSMRADMLKVFRPTTSTHANGANQAKINEMIQAASEAIKAERRKSKAPAPAAKAPLATFEPPARPAQKEPEPPRRKTVQEDSSERAARIRNQVQTARRRLLDLDGQVTALQKKLKMGRMNIWKEQRQRNAFEARVDSALEARGDVLDAKLVEEDKKLREEERDCVEQLAELRFRNLRVATIIKKQDSYLRQEREARDPFARHPAGVVFKVSNPRGRDDDLSGSEDSDRSERHIRHEVLGRGPRREDIGLSDDDDDEEDGSRDQDILERIRDQSMGGHPPSAPAMQWRGLRPEGDDDSASDRSGVLDHGESSDDKGDEYVEPVGSSRRDNGKAPAEPSSSTRQVSKVPDLGHGSHSSDSDDGREEAAAESWKQRAADNVPPLPGLAALGKGEPATKEKAAAKSSHEAYEEAEDEIYTEDDFDEELGAAESSRSV